VKVAIGHKSRTRPKRVDASTMSGTQQLSPSTNEAGPRDKSMEIYDRPHSCCVCGFSMGVGAQGPGEVAQ